MSTPTPEQLRAWADDPAESGMVPMHPNTVRAIAFHIEELADRVKLPSDEMAPLDRLRHVFRMNGYSEEATESAIAEAVWVRAGGAPLASVRATIAAIDAALKEPR